MSHKLCDVFPKVQHSVLMPCSKILAIAICEKSNLRVPNKMVFYMILFEFLRQGVQK